MGFPVNYKILQKKTFKSGDFELVPIRFEDRYQIMHWRNEQVFHLRQQTQLGIDDQDRYFNQVVSGLFTSDNPDQLLFSFLDNGVLAGYGGLVHIHWADKHAEVSFLMDTKKETLHFEQYWLTYLSLLKQIAFNELNLHKIFTYAFDVRLHLYPVIEKAGFKKEAVLKEHCRFEGVWKDVVIHAQFNPEIGIRPVAWEDSEILFSWANDEDTRKFSFNSEKIERAEHESWLRRKMEDSNACLFLCTVKENPAAFVRFDKSGNNWIIGINTAPEYRNQKLTDQFICKGLDMLKMGDSVLAYIKTDNPASTRVFEKAGFYYADETNMAGQKALVYKYELNEK